MIFKYSFTIIFQVCALFQEVWFVRVIKTLRPKNVDAFVNAGYVSDFIKGQNLARKTGSCDTSTVDNLDGLDRYDKTLEEGVWEVLDGVEVYIIL